MKKFPSLILFGFLFLAFCQLDNVSGGTVSKLPAFLSKEWDPYSRGAGDIEIGPDPNFQCPPNTPVAPHPERCELYYTCYAGYPVTLWQCYSDYLFDLRYSGCNFPYDTDCGNRQRPGTVTTTTTTPKPETTTATTTTPLPNAPAFTCPSDGGFYPIDSTACYRHYYACIQGVASVMLCPLDDLFDPVTLTCKPPNDVSCQEPAFTCEEDGFFPVEGQCTGVYFICASGVPYESLCPNSGIFDPDRLICSTPDQVSCAQGSTSTTGTTTTTTPTTTSTTTPTTTSTTTPTTTPSTTSTTTPTTTTPTTTSTTTPSTTTPTTTTPTTTSTTTPTTTSTTTSTTTPSTTTASGEYVCPPKDGKYPDPSNCHGYYVCISGVAFPSNCPSNQCFEDASDSCTQNCSACTHFFSASI